MSATRWGAAVLVAAVALATLVVEVGALAAVVVLLALLVTAVTLAAPAARRVTPSRDSLPSPTSVVLVAAERRVRYAFWASALFVILLGALDAPGVLMGGSNARYLILLIVPAALLAAPHLQALRTRWSRADVLLVVLALFAVVGGAYGKFIAHQPDPALEVGFPMLLGLSHLRVPHLTDAREAVRWLRRLVAVGLAFAVVTAFALSPLSPFAHPGYNFHDRAYFLALGVVAAVFTRRRLMLASMVSLALVIFLDYSAATYVVVAVVAMLTLIGTAPRFGRAGASLFAVLAILLVVFSFQQVSSTPGFGKSYFTAVGKMDNVDTRQVLWRQARSQIAKSPFVGSLFAGNLTVPNVGHVVGEQTERIEPHNDYLQIAFLGGFFGLALFAAWIVEANRAALRTCRALAASGRTDQLCLLRTLLVGFNSLACIALFNPVLSGIGKGASLFLFYAMMANVDPSAATPRPSATISRRAARS